MDDRETRARVGEVEALLERLDGLPDAGAREVASDALAGVLDLYGEGLRRIVERLGPAQARLLAEDELIGHLLLVHGLHPVAVEARVRAALRSVRPYLESHGGDVELLAVEPDAGVVRLRLQGSCDGCPASAMTLKGAIEEAVLTAAPEIGRVEAEGLEEHAPANSALLAIECAPALAAGRDLPMAGGGGRAASAERLPMAGGG